MASNTRQVVIDFVARGIRTLTGQTTALGGSLNSLQQQLTVNQTAMNNMTRAQLRNTSAGRALVQQNQQISASLVRVQRAQQGIGAHVGVWKKLGKVGSAAFKSVGLAIKGAGIGLLLTIAAALGEAFKKNQKIMDAFNTVINLMGFAIKPVVDFVGDLITSMVELGEKFGLFDTASDSIYSMAKAMTEAKKQSELLDAAQDELKETYEQQEEVQRQIRDNAELSNSERVQANKTLGILITRQGAKELEIVNKKIGFQKIILSLDKDNIEEQKKLKELENSRLEISNRLTGQMSEQKTNAVSLRKEAEAEVKARKDISDTISGALNKASYKLALENADGFLSELQLRQKKADDTLVEARGKDFIALKKSNARLLVATSMYNGESLGKLKAHNEQINEDNNTAREKALQAYKDANKKYNNDKATSEELNIVVSALRLKNSTKNTYIDTANANKKLESEYKVYAKSVGKVWKTFNKGRELNNKISNASIVTHTKQVDALLKSLRDSANVDNIASASLKDATIFKNKQSSDKIAFNQTLDNMRVVNSTEEDGRQEATELRAAFNAAQLAQQKEYDRKVQKDLDESIKDKRDKTREAAIEDINSKKALEDETRELEAIRIVDKAELDRERALEYTQLDEIALNDSLDSKLISETVYEEGLLAIKNNYAAKLKAIDDAKTEAQINNMSRTASAAGGMFGALSAMREADDKDGRALAYSGAVVDAASAVMGTWAGYASFGPWGTVAAAAQTVGIGATLVTQLSAINSAGKDKGSDSTSKGKYKFANGGIVGGTDYTGDRVSAGLNSGELVSNQRQKDNLLLAVQNGMSGAGGDNVSRQEFTEVLSKINSIKYVLVVDEVTKEQKVVELREERYNNIQ